MWVIVLSYHMLTVYNKTQYLLYIIQVIKLLQGDALKDLRLAYNPDITQFGWKDILNTVSQKQASLSQLDISSNALGRFGVAHGSPLMSLAGAKLDFLNLSGEQLVDDNVEVFSSALRDRQTKVPVIKLEPGNNLTDESISTLQSAAYTKQIGQQYALLYSLATTALLHPSHLSETKHSTPKVQKTTPKLHQKHQTIRKLSSVYMKVVSMMEP